MYGCMVTALRWRLAVDDRPPVLGDEVQDLLKGLGAVHSTRPIGWPTRSGSPCWSPRASRPELSRMIRCGIHAGPQDGGLERTVRGKRPDVGSTWPGLAWPHGQVRQSGARR